ncbi:hypothetical protein WJX79_002008 [Trebouxia sp. C0005]
MQVAANIASDNQQTAKPDSAHRAPELKQAPTKREKIQCLFCTKPARITCLHKLCKKCCNERHPNDCKAHDSGPVGDRDKLKQARVQALTAKASHATVPASTLDPKTSLADTKGPESPVLKGVPPGPHAINLSDTASMYHQDGQESVRWFSAGYKRLDEEQHATAAEAMQNYVTSADLLKQLCQGDKPFLSLHTDSTAPAQPAVLVAEVQVVNPLYGNFHQAMQDDVLDQEPNNTKSSSDSLGHSALLNKRRMLHLLASLPLGTAFLSVYESGSTDSTGAWLEVLRDLMACIGTPHRIVIGGSLMRGEEQDRIDFLAQARNRALEPLWLSAAALSDPSAAARGGLAKEMAAWDIFSARDTSNTMWHAQKIVFFNDVYFCAQDVFRLLQHKADMACGMDFDRPKIDGLPHPEQRRMFGWYLWHKYAVPRAIGRFLGRSGLITKHWRLDPDIQAAFQAKSTMGFYDTWVARDSDGNLFLKDPPYVTDPYSLQRIALGLPFPVKCCWNGLVVMSAAPFSQHNLRVRMHKEGMVPPLHRKSTGHSVSQYSMP